MNSGDLKAVGMKITPPRVKILKIMQTSENHHVSADDVYRTLSEQGEKIGLATIYRVLMQFVDAGLAKRHFFENGRAVFELENDDHHDHMICSKTGKVVEFYDEIIEKRQHEIAREHGFKLSDHTLILFGIFEDK